MVCLGNICRSPLAEGIMQHLADKAGLDWQVDSAGTGDCMLVIPRTGAPLKQPTTRALTSANRFADCLE